MNDLKKTDIEDIERHKHNFRMFCAFLKKEGIYLKFKELMFVRHKRSPNDLFISINEANVRNISFVISSNLVRDIDKKWSAIFTYRPISGLDWFRDRLDYDTMMNIAYQWSNFLKENNFDK